jgi:hypothetical protein
MGAWGSGPFDNDAAGDFADGVTVARIRKALDHIVRAKQPPEADEASAAVAAAECIAAARGHAPRAFPEDLGAKLPAWRKAFTAKDVSLARRALERVRKDSELADLWRESNAKGWLRALDDLAKHLAARPAALKAAAKPRRITVRVGDIAKVPLVDGSYAHGKVLHLATRWKGLILFGVYASREPVGPLCGMVSMGKWPITDGDWPLVGHADVTREEAASLQDKVQRTRIELDPPRVWVPEAEETQLSMAYSEAARNAVARKVGAPKGKPAR